ncbi:hypothetical protein CYJ66_06725 [Gardnerella vaginalis]|nr:hypothetical protein CYJ66_06725 [Gardnerella vaginalis]PKZ55248.1 hypothetical protein CYJ64_06725 [Gardnerella vaginalis]
MKIVMRQATSKTLKNLFFKPKIVVNFPTTKTLFIFMESPNKKKPSASLKKNLN